VRRNAPDDARYERKQSPGGKYMFNLRAGTHQGIGTSEQYDSADSRDRGAESAKRNAPTAADSAGSSPHGLTAAPDFRAGVRRGVLSALPRLAHIASSPGDP